MAYKKFVKWFFIIVFVCIGFIFTFNLSIDPYNKYGINVFNIEYKLTRDDRGFKIGQINAIPRIDNLIIGSSRAQTLNPEILTQSLGGISYNFGVGGGKIEDFLGLILYLKKENKLPRNILLALDFNGFNSNNELHDNFLNSKELNFLNQQVNLFEITHFLSVDTIRSSFKTLKAHLKKEKPTHYFNSYGLIVGPHQIAEEKHVQELSENYFQTQYTDGNYKIDEKRLLWYQQFLEIIKTHNISLKVILTPIYDYQYKLIQKNQELKNTYKDFLDKISSLYPFYNLMENESYRTNLSYFVDNVHYKESLGDKILKSILENTNYKSKENN
jgi:hypothetical protein